MTNKQAYCCPETQCNHAPLAIKAEGLFCSNGHFFPFAPGTNVPVFAKECEDVNEYTQRNAAEIHDNSLRWVFKTFNEDETSLRESLVARLSLTRGSKVLVTGAGAGNDLPYLAHNLDGMGEIYAQDIAQQMLLAGAERHKTTLARLGIEIHFSVSDATNLPFVDDYFDAAYHFGGINLFPDIGKGISEMNRVVRPGGTVVIGDEGMAPWLRDTELGKKLIKNNYLYAFDAPIELLPAFSRSVKLTWELCNTFYVIEFVVSALPLPVNIDVPHVGLRGGSIRTRYDGQLEGVRPELRDQIYAEAERHGISRVDFIEKILLEGLPKDQ
ncbi:MAG: methyltransferase domain-containing protein [Betaproteobacteria bacterium]